MTIEEFKVAFEQYAESRQMPESISKVIQRMLLGKYREAIEELENPQEIFNSLDGFFFQFRERIMKKLEGLPIPQSLDDEDLEKVLRRVITQVMKEHMAELMQASKNIPRFREILGENGCEI